MDYCTLYNMKAIMRTSIIRLETRRFYLKVKGFFKGICLLICDCFYYLLQNVLGVTVKKTVFIRNKYLKMHPNFDESFMKRIMTVRMVIFL